MNKKVVKVASIQFEPKQFDKSYNIKILSEMIEKAAKNNAKLIVTPEMGTTGYCWYNREEVKEHVEKIPGTTTNYFLKIAKKYNCFIVLGMPEVDEVSNLYYNTAVLIGPNGIVGKHRKSHPYIAEPKWACNGNNDHEVFDTEIGKISLLICMDLHFFETARIQALRNVDIICHISNWLAERAPAPYWINRAFENSCYIIESNRWGLERTVQFSGGSCIINPDGKIQNYLDTGNGIIYGEVDISNSQKKVLEEKVFEKRKTELYPELLNNSFTWNPNDFFNLYGKNPIPKGKKSIISVVQSFPKNNIEKNIDFIEKTVKSLKRKENSDLVVFPELFISGIKNPSERALELNSDTLNFLCKTAIKNKLYIVAGFAEIFQKNFYNSVLITGCEGILGSYHKTHLSNDDEKWATPGKNLNIFDTVIGRIGISIGTENLYPEISRILAIKGCDIILSPSAIFGKFTGGNQGTNIPHNYPIPTGYDPYHWHLMRVRAGENNVYNAFSNIISKKRNLLGKSGIFGPETFIFPRNESSIIDGKGYVSMEVDTSSKNISFSENSVRRKDMLKMRLPHHYYPLLKRGNY